MLPADFSPQQRGTPEDGEFAPRDYFLREFSDFVNGLKRAEEFLKYPDSREEITTTRINLRKLEDIELNFTPQELC